MSIFLGWIQMKANAHKKGKLKICRVKLFKIALFINSVHYLLHV